MTADFHGKDAMLNDTLYAMFPLSSCCQTSQCLIRSLIRKDVKNA